MIPMRMHVPAANRMQEAADKLKLKVVTIDAIDRAGQTPDGTIVNDLPQLARPDPGCLRSRDRHREPAHQRRHQRLRLLRSRWHHARARPHARRSPRQGRRRLDRGGDRRSASAHKAAELEKRLKDGNDLDAIAAELKLEKQTKRGLKREADDADFGSGGAAAMFAMGEGGTGIIPSPDRRRADPVQGDRGVRAGRCGCKLRARGCPEVLCLRHVGRPARPDGRSAADAIWRRRSTRPRSPAR